MHIPFVRWRNRQPTGLRAQRGQTLIVILVFSAILGAALLSLYNVAQLSTAKQQLNDAADSAAYSGASVLAQGMNYTAYTNRAMLANTAMIGQFVALRSTLAMSQWYWKNQDKTWRALAALTSFVPYLGEVTQTISNSIDKFSKFWGDKLIYGTRRLAEYLGALSTVSIGLSNQAMWVAQQVQLAESVATFELVVHKIAKDNAPDAELDPLMTATAFGPATTLGMFAYQMQPKVRKNHRTVGTSESPEDLYVNFYTEAGANIYTSPYVAARYLMPNAVGLWIASGCDMPMESVGSALFQPPAGLGKQFDTAIEGMRLIGGLLSPIANKFMCMFHRHGGTELVQLKDGSLSWTAVDAMGFNIPVVSDIVNHDFPFAGGAVTSFVDDDDVKSGSTPEAVSYFVEKLKADELAGTDNAKKYMGHNSALNADCVEYLLPAWNMYTVSTTGDNSGRCAVLATGTDDTTVAKGIWGGRLRGTADRVINSTTPERPSVTDLLAISDGTSLDLQNLLEGVTPRDIGGSPYDTGNLMPAGVTGDATSSAIVGTPNTAALQAAGTSFAAGLASIGSSLSSSRSSVSNAITQLRGAINPAAIGETMLQGLSSGDQVGTGRDGRGPNGFLRFLLKAIGADAAIDLFSLKISDGVERPTNRKLNKLLHLLNDGMPKWFWDIRIKKETIGRDPTQYYTLEITDEDPQDYNPRRYGLGPLVYAALIEKTDTIKTAQNLPAGGDAMGLPDYQAGTRPGLRAIGKARIYFRQPSDHWLNRYKTVQLANLLMPYWQVRNEGLSYADKWGLLSIEGLGNLLGSGG